VKAAYLICSGLFLAAISCERHDWEDTKVLNEPHHHDDHGDHEGDNHVDTADHVEGEH